MAKESVIAKSERHSCSWLTITKVLVNRLLIDSTAALDQKLPSTLIKAPRTPALLESLGSRLHLLGLKVVQHDDVGAGGDGFVGFFFGSAFDFDFEREATDLACKLDGGCDGSYTSQARQWRDSERRSKSVPIHHGTPPTHLAPPLPTLSPNVVVLEHNHTGQIHSVRVDTTDKHGVLFDHTETGSRLAGAGNESLEAVARLDLIQSVGPIYNVDGNEDELVNMI